MMDNVIENKSTVADLFLSSSFSCPKTQIKDVIPNNKRRKEKNYSNIYRLDAKQRTCLHLAAQDNEVALVTSLLQQGALVDALDIEGKTPLHWAAHFGHDSVVSLLLEHHANIHHINNMGRTALHEALCGPRKNNPALLVLLAHGAKIDFVDHHEKSSALHYAAWRGDKQAVINLLKHGANPNLQNVYGETPLHRAARSGDGDTVETLLKNHANIKILTFKGETALQSALFLGKSVYSSLIPLLKALFLEDPFKAKPHYLPENSTLALIWDTWLHDYSVFEKKMNSTVEIVCPSKIAPKKEKTSTLLYRFYPDQSDKKSVSTQEVNNYSAVSSSPQI